MPIDREAFERWERPKRSDWIVIPRWDEFQHYKDRNPPWIKVYTRLLQDPDYRDLTPAERGLLHGLWLAYAQAAGQLRVRSVPDALSMKVGTLQLFSLNQAGFLGFSASKPLAKCSLETETEKETPQTPLKDDPAQRKRELIRRALDLTADWQGGTSEQFDEMLDALELELHARLPTVQRYKLWDEALKRQRAN